MAQLHPRHERAIVALLTARSVLSACKKTGIPRRTMENWLRDPDFANAYKRARHRVFNNAVGRLCQAANRATSTLIDGMRGKEITHMQRLCARDILTFARDGLSADIDLRMTEIEARIEQLEGVNE